MDRTLVSVNISYFDKILKIWNSEPFIALKEYEIPLKEVYGLIFSTENTLYILGSNNNKGQVWIIKKIL